MRKIELQQNTFVSNLMKIHHLLILSMLKNYTIGSYIYFWFNKIQFLKVKFLLFIIYLILEIILIIYLIDSLIFNISFVGNSYENFNNETIIVLIPISEKIFSGFQNTHCKDEIYLLQWSFLSFLVLPQWVYLCRYLDNKTRSVWKPHGDLLNGCWRQSARKNCAISPFRPRRNLFAQLSSGIGSARGDGTRKGERAREKEKRERTGMK